MDQNVEISKGWSQCPVPYDRNWKIQKLLKIAQNGPKWLKMVKHEKFGPNVQFLNPLSTGGLHKIARFLSSLIGVPIRIL